MAPAAKDPDLDIEPGDGDPSSELADRESQAADGTVPATDSEREGESGALDDQAAGAD
jgi:hypothetical protein